MKIKELEIGNVVRFTYEVDKSKNSFQSIEFCITDLSKKYISGINMNCIFDVQKRINELSYKIKINSIIPGSFFVRNIIKTDMFFSSNWIKCY